MHKLLSTSVNKLKYLNFQNLITEKNIRNGVNCGAFKTVSLSYSTSTKQNKQG